MTRIARWILLGALLWLSPAGVAAQEPQSQEVKADQPIRVDVNLVTLRFTVRNSSGQLVNDLGKESLRVLESGQPQEIVFFQQPRHRDNRSRRLQLAFLLDVSGSTFATRAEEIFAAQTFMDNINNFTRVGIYGFTDRLFPFQPFTSDRTLALKAFQDARRHLGRTAIYESIDELVALMSTRGEISDEKAIIVISDGMDDSYSRAAATASRARQAGVVIYTILVPSSGQVYIGGRSEGGSPVNRRDEKREEKEAAFAQLSTGTEGKHFSGFEAILDFDDTLGQINDDLYGNLYTVGYYSDSIYVPNLHLNIDVIPPPGLTVSTPFTHLPEQLAPKRSLVAAFFTEREFSARSLALPGQFREIAAEMDILSGRNGGGEDGLPLRIKINPLSFSGATRQGVSTQLGVLGLLTRPDGSEAVRLREIFRVSLTPKQIKNGQGIIYTKKLLAPPGRYELRLALLELSSWRLTSFHEQVRVVSASPGN